MVANTMLRKCCTIRMVFVWTILVVLLLGGSLLLAFWGIPKIIKAQVHKDTELKQGTDQWDRFEELPFPIDYSIRFFEVTNPDDVLNKNTTPILKETEPYTYKLSMKKKNIRFDDEDEDSVTYDRHMSFEFDNSGTTKETDKVTIVNAILLAALQITGPVQRLAMAGCLNKILSPFGMGDMFIKDHTVREILFDGINFSFANYSELGYACKIIRKQMTTLIGGIRVIEHIDENDGNDYLKFSMFGYKLDSYSKSTNPDGIYTVNRGIKDEAQLGNIMRWNGETMLDTWGNSKSTNNDTCNAVVGTDSTIYKPDLNKDDDLAIFNTDLCRAVKLVYKSADESYKGITGYRYECSPTTFRSSTLNVENDCFCAKGTQNVAGEDDCFLDGIFDISPCLGAPVLVSQPHFLNADAKYVNAVEGLSPDASKHNIYLLIEPNTGTPLVGMKRIQLNSVMRREPMVSFLTPDTMYEAVMPILWLEEGVNLPQKYVDLINDQYFKSIKITDGVKYALIALFSTLLAVCLYFMWRTEYFQKKST